MRVFGFAKYHYWMTFVFGPFPGLRARWRGRREGAAGLPAPLSPNECLPGIRELEIRVRKVLGRLVESLHVGDIRQKPRIASTAHRHTEAREFHALSGESLKLAEASYSDAYASKPQLPPPPGASRHLALLGLFVLLEFPLNWQAMVLLGDKKLLLFAGTLGLGIALVSAAHLVGKHLKNPYRNWVDKTLIGLLLVGMAEVIAGVAYVRTTSITSTSNFMGIHLDPGVVTPLFVATNLAFAVIGMTTSYIHHIPGLASVVSSCREDDDWKRREFSAATKAYKVKQATLNRYAYHATLVQRYVIEADRLRNIYRVAYLQKRRGEVEESWFAIKIEVPDHLKQGRDFDDHLVRLLRESLGDDQGSKETAGRCCRR